MAGEIQDVASAKTLLRPYDFQLGNHSYCEELLVAPFIDRIDRYFFDPGWDYGDARLHESLGFVRFDDGTKGLRVADAHVERPSKRIASATARSVPLARVYPC